MLGEKVSRYGLSSMGGGNYKPGDQMGLKHNNSLSKRKSIVSAQKDIAENQQLGRYEPVHVHRHKNKKSHLEK